MLGALHSLNLSRCNVLISCTNILAVDFLRQQKELLVKCQNIHIQLAPLDFVPHLNRWFEVFPINQLAIYEMELWPNLLMYCKKNNTPVFWMAARFTPRARKLYFIWRQSFLQMLDSITWAQTHNNPDTLPLASEKISKAVDYKTIWFLKNSQNFKKQTVQNTENISGIAFVSLRLEELKLCLPAIAELAEIYNIIIFPRYINTSSQFLKKLSSLGFKLHSKKPNHSMLVVDRLGKIPFLSERFELSIIGGSFCKTGGHTLWESFSLNKFCLCGPNYSSQKTAVDFLKGFGLAKGGILPAQLAHIVQNQKWPNYSQFEKARTKLEEQFNQSCKELAQKLGLQSNSQGNGKNPQDDTKVLQA